MHFGLTFNKKWHKSGDYLLQEIYLAVCKNYSFFNLIRKVNEQINTSIEDPNFWNDTSNAQLIMRDKKILEKTIDVIKSIL